MSFPWQPFWQLSTRSPQQEFLDDPAVPVHELHENLRDLRWINALLGNRRLLCAVVQRLWRQLGSPPVLSILDVGTGAGDIPMALSRWGLRRGVNLITVAVDLHREVVRYAHAVAHAAPAIHLVQADGLCLPFRAHTFDIVISSAMLHHLDEDAGIVLLQAMAAVARYAMVISDLRRSRWCYWLARLFMPLCFRNRLTRHDGPLSVLRAYRLEEVRAMAVAAGLTHVQVRHALWHRVLLIARVAI